MKHKELDTPIYNTIGKGYNTTRRADPYIAERMIAQLQPVREGLYLDVGCGTGNYLRVFTQMGYRFYGIDPSDTMLEIAVENCPGAELIKSSAESIPFADHFFDGATAMFTFHHWQHKQQALNELYRVLKPEARLSFLSFTAEQMDGYWLAHYFPRMIKRSGEIVPDQSAMCDMLYQAGFQSVETEKYFVHNGLQDHFLYSNKYKPGQYLNPEIRSGISSFSAFSTPEEVAEGLNRLESDIRSGAIQSVIRRYENSLGDYLFYTAIKN